MVSIGPSVFVRIEQDLDGVVSLKRRFGVWFDVYSISELWDLSGGYFGITGLKSAALTDRTHHAKLYIILTADIYN